MAKLDLALVVRTVDKATAPLRRIQKSVRNLGRQTGLDRVGRQVRVVGRQMGRVGREAGMFARRFGIAAAVAGGAIFGLTSRFAMAGDSIAKTADKLGVGITELQRLRYAAQIAGVEQRTFDMALQRFTRRAAEAAAGTGEAEGALKFLGIQLKDTAGKVRPTGVLLQEVADRMAAIEDPALRVRIAFKLFDSEGVSMVNMLKDGAPAIRAMGDEAERLGIITEAQARAGERFRDAQVRMTRALSFLGHTIGADTLPGIELFIDRMTKLFVEMRPHVVREVRLAFRNLGAVVDFVSGVFGGFSDLTGLLPDKIKSIGAEIGWITPIVVALTAALGVGLMKAVVGLFAPLAQLAVLVATNPILAAAVAIGAAAYLIYDNWEGIVQFFAGIWQGIKDAFFDSIEAIRGAWRAFVDFFAANPPAWEGGPKAAAAGVMPSLFQPSDATAAGGGGRGESGKAAVTVDFRGMPRGARVETRADSDTDLEVTTGFAMQGAL